MRLLIEAGADPSTPSDDGPSETTLHWAASLWQAAALGMHEHVLELVAADPLPTQQELDEAFWQACHGG